MGWMSNLEEWPKCKGRSRKTIPYWRKLVREAGWDCTRIAGLTAARGEWKQMVKERMEHLEKYEWSQGNRWDGEDITRNAATSEGSLECDVCGKRCKSKAGLTIHRKRLHEVSSEKKSFVCECGKSFRQEANLKNHRKRCGEGVSSGPRVYKGERGECPDCGKVMATTNIARHRREACVGGEASLGEA